MENLSGEQIEQEIDRLKSEGAKTELWMSGWSKRQLDKIAGRDQQLRDAFEAGYRNATDRSPVTWIISIAAAFAAGAFFEFLLFQFGG